MQSNRFLKIAEKIVEQNKEIFNTLLEFEETKRIRTKVKLNFTIDKNVASRFKRLCREKGYNMSAKIEQAMRDVVEE